MTVSLEREIGGLRADVQNLTTAVFRLVNKLDEHITADNDRFRAIDQMLSESAGGRKVVARGRATLYQFLSIAGGGAVGAVIARLAGVH